ncbi:MAG: hypothetical protein MJ149_02015 [Clostridia bacterium]|nr:hypothetical protein [Clostridia bacterium]
MFACFCLSASLVLFAFDKRDKDEVTLKELNDELNNSNFNDDELKTYTKFAKKTRKSITSTQFGLFAGAVLLIIMGIVVMI